MNNYIFITVFFVAILAIGCKNTGKATTSNDAAVKEALKAAPPTHPVFDTALMQMYQGQLVRMYFLSEFLLDSQNPDQYGHQSLYVTTQTNSNNDSGYPCPGDPRCPPLNCTGTACPATNYIYNDLGTAFTISSIVVKDAANNLLKQNSTCPTSLDPKIICVTSVNTGTEKTITLVLVNIGTGVQETYIVSR
ncbi:MAG TPA: hypothetical protein PK006_06510 [Saprospiraceae bacterium]|nr:hypothetical protein [Saprospiraceae bacterium]